MVCDIANAYPANGTCLDATKGNSIKYTFHGDYAWGAASYVYDAVTGKKLNSYYTNVGNYIGYKTGGFYNGEEISTTLPPEYIKQDKEYCWKARIFSKMVDIDNGEYPDILACKGNFVDNPVVTTSVSEFSLSVKNASTKVIAVDSNLPIKIPSYIFIGDEKRIVTSYSPFSGVLSVNIAFSIYPDVGTEVTICETEDLPNIDTSLLYVYIDTYSSALQAPYSFYWDNDNTVWRYNTCIKNLTTGEWAVVTNYDEKNGVLYLLNSFSTEPTSADRYEIYCNYIETPYFYFITKATPVITPSLSLVQNWNTAMLKCEAVLESPTNVAIKSYYWEIYEVTDTGDVLIDTSKLIYSGRMEYLCRKLKNTAYKARIIATTRDNVTVTSDFVGLGYIMPDTTIDNLYAWFDNDKNAVVLNWDNLSDNTSYCIMRTDSSGNLEYLETIIGSATEYYDYKAISGESYVYSVTPKTETDIYNALETSIDVELNRMSIYFLSEVEYQRPSPQITLAIVNTNYMYNDAQYKVEKAYCIDLDIGEIKITHNINRNIQVGYRGLPIVSTGADNYDSFPLEFTFGQVSCQRNKQMEIFAHTHKDYLEWREYVASGLPVVIKDTIGNIWFGTITDHSATPDVVGEPNLYKISIEFTQSRNMSETRILSS